MDCLKAEMTVAKNYLAKNSANDKFTTDCLKNVIQDNIYPNLFKLIQVAFTLPISSDFSYM